VPHAWKNTGTETARVLFRRSARDELLWLRRLADTHSVDEFRDPASATHRASPHRQLVSLERQPGDDAKTAAGSPFGNPNVTVCAVTFQPRCVPFTLLRLLISPSEISGPATPPCWRRAEPGVPQRNPACLT
jgi:hypothetical protein